MGRRGAGKSTWLRATFPGVQVFDLLSEESYQRWLASQGLFADQLRAVASDKWVIVAEVQRLPGFLNEVHRFSEEKRLRFVLCGSSARKLRRSGINLLVGRALHRSMHPFVPEELGPQFDLEEALRFGLLPFIWDSAAKD
jgi:predicted AAA+ superfamily ATPase